MEIRTIGIDLGKTVFHFVCVNARGEVVVRKKSSRTQLLRFNANLPQCLIGMEAQRLSLLQPSPPESKPFSRSKNSRGECRSHSG